MNRMDRIYRINPQRLTAFILPILFTL